LVMNVKMIDVNDGNFWAVFDAEFELTASDTVKKEASLINSRVFKWAYELPAHKYRYMSRKHSDVLKKPKIQKKNK